MMNIDVFLAKFPIMAARTDLETICAHDDEAISGKPLSTKRFRYLTFSDDADNCFNFFRIF